MRIAVWIVILLMSLAVVPSVASSVIGPTPHPEAVATPSLTIPSAIFQAAAPACIRNSNANPSPDSLIDLPAAGTGASATYDIDEFENNTGVNATVSSPTGASLASAASGNGQFLLLGVGEPITSKVFTAVGVADVNALGISVESYPVAYLPNGTLIDNLNNYFSPGTTDTYAITWVHGWWWSYTYDGNAVTGATDTGSSIPWENGTYNLGVSVASGVICESGYRVGPSFVAIAYGEGTAATPSMPTTSVPWALGIEPKGSSSPSYVAPATNAIPQLNASLGVIGIEGHAQDAALGIDHLKVGSSVAFPGSFKSIWGNYKVLALNQSTLTPVSASLAYNANQAFNATSIDENGNWLPGANFQWALSPAGLGTLNRTTGSTVLLTAGSSTITYGALWANITYNCSSIHDQANVTVTPTGGPSIGSYTAMPSAIEVGGATFLNVTNGAWPRPITYSYVGLPSPCVSANVTSLKCAPSAPGVYPVRVYLNDSKGHSSTGLASFTTYADLALTSFTISPATLTVNTSTTVKTVSVGGIPGSTGITYDYTGLPSGCSEGLEPATFTCSPNATGTYTAWVFVNDSAGHGVSGKATVTVNMPVAITAFSASPSTIPFGGTTFINVTAHGGTPPYVYAFHDLPAGCTTASVTSLRCTPTASGNFLVRVSVNDSDGAEALGATPLTVSPPAKPIITSFTASPSSLQVGWTTFLNVTAEGAAPLSYAYASLPTGCASSNTASLTCTPTAAGDTTATVTVTDVNSNTVTATVAITVKANPTLPPTIASFTASPASIDTGWTTFLNVSASGGTAPLTYAYTGLPTGCVSADLASLPCVPSAAGTFLVQVFVNDSAGHSVSSTASLTVAAAPSNGSTSGSTSPSSPLLLYLVVAAVAAAAVIAVVLVLRRRQGAIPPAPPPPTGWSPAPPPPQGAYGAPAQPMAGPPPPTQPPKAW